MTNFTFTAFEQTDLVTNPIACHATFSMPAAATLVVIVEDDDARLSGDAFRLNLSEEDFIF